MGYDDDLNLYAYVGNDPVNQLDPSGRQLTPMSPSPLVLQQVCGGDLACAARAAEESTIGPEGAADVAAFYSGEAALAACARGPCRPLFAAIGGATRLAYTRLFASRGFQQAGAYIRAAFGAIRQSSRAGTRTLQYSGTGGGSGAARLFDRLTEGRSVARDGGRIGRLEDGSVVQMSSSTRNGVTTTSVRISREREGSRIVDRIKVRFEEPAAP